MPLYDFQCGAGHEFERTVPLSRFSEEQFCDCGEAARRKIAAPRVISDCMPPMHGPGGKLFDSVSAYKAAQDEDHARGGQKMHIIDGKDTTKFEKPKPDRKEIREAIKRGIQDVKYGRVKPPVNIGEAANA